MSQDVYNVLRDFQLLIAAHMALGVAIIAYVSAQRVSSKQADAALMHLERASKKEEADRANLQRQLERATTKEVAELQRRTVALKFFLNFRLLQLRTTLLDRLSFAERLLSYNELYEGGITRQNRQNDFVLSDLEHAPLLLQNEWNINVGWGDLALLELPTQRAIYNVTTDVGAVDSTLSDMKATVQRDLPITKFSVDPLVDRIKTLIQTVEETITAINNSVSQVE